MTLKSIAAALLALSIGAALASPSAAEEPIGAAQKKAIEQVIHDYIIANPEVLIEAVQEYRARQDAAEREKARQNLSLLGDQLKAHPASPVGGKAGGDVTVVEFFDYNCGYCKRVFPTIQKLLKDDGNIRYVLKEYPILGPESVIASKAALATWNSNPDKYMALHTELMSVRGQLTENKIFALAEKIGLDAGQLRTDMEKPEVTDEISRNIILAEQLGITGTPAFVVGDHMVPGAVDMSTLLQLIAAARKG